jgi:hypothetical protein
MKMNVLQHSNILLSQPRMKEATQDEFNVQI